MSGKRKDGLFFVCLFALFGLAVVGTIVGIIHLWPKSSSPVKWTAAGPEPKEVPGLMSSATTVSPGMDWSPPQSEDEWAEWYGTSPRNRR